MEISVLLGTITKNSRKTEMFKFIIKRLGRYVVLLFMATSMTFFMASWFMHPRSNYESRTPRPPQPSIERSLNNANLNDHTNIFVRYWRWLTGVVTRWDWGMTPDGQRVNTIMAPRIVASTELVTLATILSILVGVSLGVYTALRGVALLMQSIEKVKSRINPDLEVYGVLVTMYTNTIHSQEVLQRVYEAFQGKVFHSIISRSIKLPDATVAAAPITMFAPEHRTAKEYREVAREIISEGIIA